GGDKDLASPRLGLGSPRVSRASSPEGRHLPSPQLGTKAPVARPRMSAQEQLERMRRNQECGRPLPRPTSPRLLTLGRILSPARRQPDVEQRSKEHHPLLADFRRSPGAGSQPLSSPGY
ncbi:PLEKHA4 isoform 3, partial [Pongo abelii]